MRSVPQLGLTLQEYLAFDRASDERHEFEYGEIVAMSGGTQFHSRIAVNLAVALSPHAKRSGCVVFSSDMRVVVPRLGHASTPTSASLADRRMQGPQIFSRTRRS